MDTQPKPIPDRVNQWVRTWIATFARSGSETIELLAGDGSPRQFYRVHVGPKTFVVLCDPGWAFSKDYAAHQQFLTRLPIAVPRFLKEDPASGFLAMEDLGDELLQFRLKKEPTKKMEWLQRATALLADLHARAYPVPGSLPVATRKFDERKYGEELAFTFEHLHEKFFGLAPPPTDAKARIQRFCAELERLKPEVFCHRDYHCRNLLVREERLYLIDFQDARIGPPQYDLASLVYDAYISLSDTERTALLDGYREKIRGTSLEASVRWPTFLTDLEAVGLQRVVKAAGSFASFFNRYGKDTHLPYLRPALESARKLARSQAAEVPAYRDLFPIDAWLGALEKKRL